MAMIYCRECGAKHSDKAAACPRCGYKARCGEKSALVYALLAFFLGMWGVHKFYAGRNVEGVAMLLMGTIGWLLILPGVIVCVWAFIDFVIGLLNIDSPEKIFNR